MFFLLLIDEVKAHDLYKFSSTNTPKLELQEPEPESASPPGPQKNLSVVHADDSSAKLMVERSKMSL